RLSLSKHAMMQSILQLIEEHGLVVVFLNVLVEQAGAPVPAYPILGVAGALLDTSGYSAFALLGVAAIADGGQVHSWICLHRQCAGRRRRNPEKKLLAVRRHRRGALGRVSHLSGIPVQYGGRRAAGYTDQP